jgi:hypothetical protein
MRPFCDPEIAAQERASLNAEQASRLEFLKGFNKSMVDRIQVGYAVAFAHRSPPQRHNEIGVDDSPVSACLLKALADGNNEKEIAPFAQEGYALRLLAGSGVEKNREEAKRYLERAALTWRYGSAAMRVAMLHLEDAPALGAVEGAVRFARIALASVGENPPGSIDPSPARAMLFEVYLSGKYGPKNIADAKELFIDLRRKGFNDKLMLDVARKHPEFESELQVRIGAQEGASSIQRSGSSEADDRVRRRMEMNDYIRQRQQDEAAERARRRQGR